MDEGDVVNVLRQVREQVADPVAAPAVLLEVPARFDDAALVLVPATAKGFDLDGLVVHALHVGLVVEGVDVAGAAVHVQEDDALRLGRKVRLLRRERVDERRDAVGRDRLLGEEVVAEHGGEGRGREAGAGLPQELAARPAAELAVAVGHRRSPQSRKTNSFKFSASKQ